jgi:hypothetical protein
MPRRLRRVISDHRHKCRYRALLALQLGHHRQLRAHPGGFGGLGDQLGASPVGSGAFVGMMPVATVADRIGAWRWADARDRQHALEAAHPA